MSKQPELKRLSSASYFIVALTLGLTVLLLVWVFLHPTMGDLAMIEREIPQYEREFGFQGGWLEYAPEGGTAWRGYGVAHVDPQGRLAQLGFRDGDIPVGHHGDGVGQFCWLLKRARAGEAATIWVANASAGLDGERRRKIVVSAAQQSR